MAIVVRWKRFRKPPRRLVLASLLLPVIPAVILILAAAAAHAPALLCGLAAGVLVRLWIQRTRLAQLRETNAAGRLASFAFDGEVFGSECDPVAMLRWIDPWAGRIAAAVLAISVTIAAWRWSAFGLTIWFSHAVQSRLAGRLHGFDTVLDHGALLLPFAVGAVVLLAKGPERLWIEQGRAVIAQRCRTALAEIQLPREVDGLAAGNRALWRIWGCDLPWNYRSAMLRHAQAHPAEVAMQPSLSVALLDVVTEMARQDSTQLAAALLTASRLESRLKTLEALAGSAHEPLIEAQADDLQARLRELPAMAAERRWQQMERRAEVIGEELDTLFCRLRRRPPHGSTTLLAPGSDPYRLLGIGIDIPTPQLRKLRLRLAQIYHPDVTGGMPNGAKMAELNAAYDAVMSSRESKESMP